MENGHSIAAKIIAGEAKLANYDLDSDFTDDELRALIDADIIAPDDLSDERASDMIINDMLSYGEYPLEKFSHFEQIRQLQHGIVSRAEFREKIDLDEFDGDDWLKLLKVWPEPELDVKVPWEMIRDEAFPDSWFDFLAVNPRYAEKADWQRLQEQGKRSHYFRMLAEQPDLWARTPDKAALLNSDSAEWVELIIKRPEFARIYPLSELDEVDEVEHLLLHRPELVREITWYKANSPVKLYIGNTEPDIMKFFPEQAKYISTEKSPLIKMILQKALFYETMDAHYYANIIVHNPETFAGIYSTQTAEAAVRIFRDAAAFAKLPLTIRTETVEL